MYSSIRNPIALSLLSLIIGACTSPTVDDRMLDSNQNSSTLRSISGDVTTWAGTDKGHNDGQGITAKFGTIRGIDVDKFGNLYVIDNQCIRKIDKQGYVKTIVGSPTSSGFEDEITIVNGKPYIGLFDWPKDLAVDINGNAIVADSNNYKIRRIGENNKISTIAGSTHGYKDGKGPEAQFEDISYITCDNSGNIYVVESSKHRVRKISPDGDVTTFVGGGEGHVDGIGLDARLSYPGDITFGQDGLLYLIEGGLYSEGRIRTITLEGKVDTFYHPKPTHHSFYDGKGVAIDSRGRVYVSTKDKIVYIEKNPANGELRTNDFFAGSHIAGYSDGYGSKALFDNVQSLAIFDNDIMYVADTGNHKIRKID